MAARSTVLEEGKLSADQSRVLCAAFEQQRPRLRRALALHGVTFAQLVDVQWRLDLDVRSSAVERSKAPVYFVALKTREPNGTLGERAFACSFQELQDLLAKLRDAARQAERIASVAK